MVTVTEAIGYLKRYCTLYGLNDVNFTASMAGLHAAAAAGRIPFFVTDCGCTKGVIIFEDADFVIKLPFREYGGYPFYRSESAREWDYCLRELEIYEAAQVAGVAQFLAKTSYAGQVDGHPVYVQERIENIGSLLYWENRIVNSSIPRRVNAQALRLMDARTTGKGRFGHDLILSMILDYGFRFTQRFMNLCVNMNAGGDWHHGNYGTRGAAEAVAFCDYSGFRD